MNPDNFTHKKTYLFYDLETSGLNKCFDQVLQFAAIRTDVAFNEITRHNILIKLRSDVIPSPKASITHQIDLGMLNEEGICEYEAIGEIYKLFNTPYTISIGYNNLNFDDEFLRFAFYHNLLPPYTHQFANGCCRMDLYPITVMYYLFKPKIIAWPILENHVSLKLEQLNHANSLVSRGNAHDAMHDVEVTLELARRLCQDKEMWQYLSASFDKNQDMLRSNKLPIAFNLAGIDYNYGILVDGSFGVKNAFKLPALNLGMHNHYKNQQLWLPLDSPKLAAATTPEEFVAKTFALRKKFGEMPIVLPKTERFIADFSSSRLKLAEENIARLKSDEHFLKSIVSYYKEYKYPEIPNLDADAALYQKGFLSDKDLWICQKFHQADLSGKVELLNKLQHGDLYDRAVRLLVRNYRSESPSNILQEYAEYETRVNPRDEADAMLDYKSEKRLTPKAALSEIKSLRESSSKNLSLQQLKILVDLEGYLAQSFNIK